MLEEVRIMGSAQGSAVTSRSVLAAGIGLGAGVVYFFDRDRGARRRALLRDRASHAAAMTRHAMGTAARDAQHRTAGIFAYLRGLGRDEPVDDHVIVARVRAKLGRLVSHPHAVQVSVSDGVVILQGPILDREVARLRNGLRRIRGVIDVVDELEHHQQAAHVPALQGGRAPAGDRLDILQTNWAPATRALAGGAGAALVTAGALGRGVPRAAAALIGSALLARAAANLPMNRLTGIGSRRRAADVQKTITINAPVGEVYTFWSLYENFPRFMSRVLDVTSSAARPYQSHWTVSGPAGMPVAFDTEITRAIPNQLIAWKTLPGSPVAHAGVVRFDPGPHGGTRIHIRMSYNPPAGRLGHGVAAAFGADPKTSMDEDLVRMKTLIETGRAPHDAARPVSHDRVW
jgi:uncharacterized membrane protein